MKPALIWPLDFSQLAFQIGLDLVVAVRYANRHKDGKSTDVNYLADLSRISCHPIIALEFHAVPVRPWTRQEPSIVTTSAE